jgi:hypothetical protein
VEFSSSPEKNKSVFLPVGNKDQVTRVAFTFRYLRTFFGFLVISGVEIKSEMDGDYVFLDDAVKKEMAVMNNISRIGAGRPHTDLRHCSKQLEQMSLGSHLDWMDTFQ